MRGVSKHRAKQTVNIGCDPLNILDVGRRVGGSDKDHGLDGADS
jgi:hypothetical protein